MTIAEGEKLWHCTIDIQKTTDLCRKWTCHPCGCSLQSCFLDVLHTNVWRNLLPPG